MKVGYEHPSFRSLSSHDYSLLTTLGGALFLEVLQYQVDAWNARGKPLFHLTTVLSGRGRRDLRFCGVLDPPLPGVEGPLSSVPPQGISGNQNHCLGVGLYPFSYQQVAGGPSDAI
jgi:hypothetical protein